MRAGAEQVRAGDQPQDCEHSSRRHLAVRRARADTCSKQGLHISQMRAVDVRDIANQFSLGRIAPTTSFVRSHNAIFCATPKRAPPVAIFQIVMKEPFDRLCADSPGFLTRIGVHTFHSGICKRLVTRARMACLLPKLRHSG